MGRDTLKRRRGRKKSGGFVEIPHNMFGGFLLHDETAMSMLGFTYVVCEAMGQGLK